VTPLRKLLIVSPHFPPVNAPDMQRVRMSLPYYEEFGWRPTVLAVAPEQVEGALDSRLAETVPADVRVISTRAFSRRLTRPLGIGNPAIRALPWLATAGERETPDLVYFSTTQFACLPLGRLWRGLRGTPFVVDLQDPWMHDPNSGGRARGKKASAMTILHRHMEPWTMEAVAGITAVTQAYIDTLRVRYPRLQGIPAIELPFGAAKEDFDRLDRTPRPPSDALYGVYVGRVNEDMLPAVEAMLRALSQGLRSDPSLYSRVRLRFVGTAYDPAASPQMQPLIDELDLAGQVSEEPARVPYFEALQILVDADFLLVPGSLDPDYTASKVFPAILARRPLLALFNERSSVVDILSRCRAGTVVSFGATGIGDEQVAAFRREWSGVLKRLPFEPEVDWDEFAPYTAREMTRRQCQLFDRVLTREARAA